MKQFEYKIDKIAADKSNLVDYLNENGKDGWELVSHYASLTHYVVTFIFKREVA